MVCPEAPPPQYRRFLPPKAPVVAGRSGPVAQRPLRSFTDVDIYELGLLGLGFVGLAHGSGAAQLGADLEDPSRTRSFGWGTLARRSIGDIFWRVWAVISLFKKARKMVKSDQIVFQR